MYPLSRLRQIRELDFFLFRGIPEAPDQTFERDSNSFGDSRSTRRPLGAVSTEHDVQSESDAVEQIELDLDTGTLSYVNQEHSTQADTKK